MNGKLLRFPPAGQAVPAAARPAEPAAGSSLSDEALVVACGIGDSAALGELFDRLHQTVYRFLSRYLGPRNPDIDVQAHLQTRVLLRQGMLSEAEAAVRQACQDGAALPAFEPNRHATLICILLAAGRIGEALEVAEHVASLLQRFGCLGNVEVELRLAISETFHAAGDHERACKELSETLRQIRLRADDISDPFWRNSYLTRNPYCTRAQLLGREWRLDVAISAPVHR